MMEYEKDPAAIYAASFAAIRAEADLARLPASLEGVAVRLIHACGMTDLAADLRYSEDVADAARAALAKGAAVLVDTEMTAHAVIRSRLPRGCELACTLNDPAVPDLAKSMATTRSAAALTLWRDRLEGSVVAIGNAPTALFALLEMLDQGAPKPAAILGFPVGFVGAAESKQELAANSRGVPFLTLTGRRGGSAMAGAAVNALAAGEKS